LPPKLLNLKKILKMQLKRLKPMLRPGSVSMAVSVVSITQTPYLTLCEVPTATANTAPTAATVLVTVATATVLKVLMERLTKLQQSRLTFRARATYTITQQSFKPFLQLR
jgi:Kef-type K+ transport system membrane component KefB